MESNAQPGDAPRSGSALTLQRKVADLLATWAVSKDSLLGELFGSVAGYAERLGSDTAALLERALTRAESHLPVDLLAEIRRAVDAPPKRPVAAADQLISRVTDVLAPEIETRRNHLTQQLRAWSSHLDVDRTELVMSLIWDSESAETLSDQLTSLDSLDRVEEMLRKTLQQVLSDVDRSLNAASQQPMDQEVLARGQRALQSHDPGELMAVEAALKADRDRVARKSLESRLEESRRRLEALQQRIRQLAEDLGMIVDPVGIRVLKTVDALAEQCLAEAKASSVDLLEDWSRSIEVFLQGGLGTSSDLGRERQLLAEQLQDRLALGLQRTGQLDGGERAEVERAAEAISQQLQDSLIAGGAPFLDAVQKGLELFRAMSQGLSRQVQESGESLRRSAHLFGDFLKKKGSELPTARVVQARVWLEQVDGTVASGDVSGVRALGAAIEKDFQELKKIAALLQKRTRSGEQSERDMIQREIEWLADYTRGGAARRTAKIERLLEDADRRELSRLSGMVNQESSLAEREHRRDAHEILAKAERWLGPSGRRSRKAESEKGRELAKASIVLRSELDGDDLTQIVESMESTRTALYRASLTHRPGIRWALATGAFLLIAIGLTLTAYLMGRPGDVTVKFSAPASNPVSISLYLENDLAHSEKMTGEEVVIKGLRDGTYEVYLNERYSGAVIQVPRDWGKTIEIVPPLPPEQ